jgi:hypothetical protein
VTRSTDAQPFEDNAALIGGIVGGVVALLVVGGLIAYLVARSRRRGKGESNSNAALQSVRQGASSNDMRDAESYRSDYGALSLSPPESSYDVIGVQNSTEYDQGDLTKFNE